MENEFKFIKQFRIDSIKFELYGNGIGAYITVQRHTDKSTKTKHVVLFKNKTQLRDCFEDEFSLDELLGKEKAIAKVKV